MSIVFFICRRNAEEAMIIETKYTDSHVVLLENIKV